MFELIKPVKPEVVFTPKGSAHLLLRNILLGLILTMLLWPIFNYSSILTVNENFAIDSALLLRKHFFELPNIKEKDIPEFVFLDIDNETHAAWDYPVITPRDKLKETLENLVKNQPKLIMVDIEIRGREKESMTEADKRLFNYLKNYKQACQKQCVPILFLKTFQQRFESSMHPREVHNSFLDEAIQASYPYTQWVSASFFASGYDNVMREWLLWQATCDDETQAVNVIPSVQLFIATFSQCSSEQNQPALHARQLLEEKLLPFSPRKCDKPTNVIAPKLLEICDGLKIGIKEHTRAQRILYSIPWVDDELYQYGDIQGNPIVQRQSLQQYTMFNEQDRKNTIEGRIVIIGGTHFDSNDFHNTPIGNMPGPMMIINSIHSLLQYGVLKNNPFLGMLIIQAILISLITACYYIFILFIYYLLSPKFTSNIFKSLPISYCGWVAIWSVFFTAISMVLLVVISSYFIENNSLWINYAIPLFFVQYILASSNINVLRYRLRSTGLE